MAFKDIKTFTSSFYRDGKTRDTLDLLEVCSHLIEAEPTFWLETAEYRHQQFTITCFFQKCKQSRVQIHNGAK